MARSNDYYFWKKNIIPNLTTSNLNTVAFRIPKKKITLELFKRLNFPVAAPSANIFGYISPTSIDHVHKNFSNGIDYILDGGDCKLGIESTIIGLNKNKILVYRLGSLILNELKKVIIYSNRKLENAIYLYKSFGFTEVELEKKSNYKRADIKLELDLQ